MEKKLESFILYKQILAVLIIGSVSIIMSQVVFYAIDLAGKFPLWLNAIYLIFSVFFLILTTIYLSKNKREELTIIAEFEKLPNIRKTVHAVEDIDFTDDVRHLDEPYKMIEGFYTGRLNGTYKLEGNITKKFIFEKVISPDIKEDYIVYKDIPEKYLEHISLRKFLPIAKYFTSK